MLRRLHVVFALALACCAGCLEMVDFTPHCNGTVCDGQCVDASSDVNNCGACGHYCSTDQTCNSGSCQCADPKLKACGHGCTDTATDPHNCGQCGAECGVGTCQAGSCVCPGVKCDGTCTDVATDAANCGQCGHACGNGFVCSNAACVAVCGGTVTPCIQRSEADCTLGGGCEWRDATCYGGTVSCGVYSHSCSQCGSTPGCSCDANAICVGSTTCEHISPVDCNSYLGCSFGKACVGTPTPCAGLSQYDCAPAIGCQVQVQTQ